MQHLFKRTIAYFIDCSLAYGIIMLLIQWLILSNIRNLVGITDAWFENSWNVALYVWLSISLPIWLYFIYFDSDKAKGTFGKRFLKLSVNNQDGQKISLSKSFQRTFFKLLPWEIAHIGLIFPTPIYSAEDPKVGALTIIGIVLFTIYVLSILISPTGQSLYDRILNTRVNKKGNEVTN